MAKTTFYKEGENLIIRLGSVIDASNASDVEKELFTIRKENTDGALVLDAADLTYISSAGLRSVLKLQKQEKNLTLVNASKEVYDVFDMTGMTKVMEIQKKLRDVSIEGLKKIGQGGTAAVYQLDEDKIIKVYKPVFPLDVIRKEKEISQKLFLAGVPTAVPYEVVKCGDEIGVIYELLYAKTLLDLMISDPEHGEDYVRMMADFFKETSAIEVKDFPEIKPMMRMSIYAWIKAGLITQEEMPKYAKIYDNVPDAEGFVHGDYHPGNIMKVGDELMMIDLASASKGHKIMDLAGLGTFLFSLAEYMTPERYTAFTGLTPETGKNLFRAFIDYYFKDADEAYARKAETQILVIANTRVVSGAAAV
ncbi:MAG: anti-sigma factor antagonist, partial [Lachnospiraceae bacterium]|nr:anti-sigma factor antagonist [Lachnospiraceae bacterium]